MAFWLKHSSILCTILFLVQFCVVCCFVPYAVSAVPLCRFVRVLLCVVPVWYLSERVVAVGRLPVVPVLINSYPQGLFLQTSGFLQDRSLQTSGYLQLQDMPQQKTTLPVIPAFIHRQQAVCEAYPCWQPATSGPGSYSPSEPATCKACTAWKDAALPSGESRNELFSTKERGRQHLHLCTVAQMYKAPLTSPGGRI